MPVKDYCSNQLETNEAAAKCKCVVKLKRIWPTGIFKVIDDNFFAYILVGSGDEFGIPQHLLFCDLTKNLFNETLRSLLSVLIICKELLRNTNFFLCTQKNRILFGQLLVNIHPNYLCKLDYANKILNPLHVTRPGMCEKFLFAIIKHLYCANWCSVEL